MRYGVVPAGGLGTRMSHLGHSKELVKVAGRPVIEYILDRLAAIRPSRIIITTHPDKSDLNQYLTAVSPHRRQLTLLPDERKGLLDGIISPAEGLSSDDSLFFGLPDTVWYPETGFQALAMEQGELVLGVLPSATPQLYGSVTVGGEGEILSLEEKPAHPHSPWIWGFGRLSVSAIPDLLALAQSVSGASPDFTTAMGLYCRRFGGRAVTFKGGCYLDVGSPAGLSQAEVFMAQAGAQV